MRGQNSRPPSDLGQTVPLRLALARQRFGNGTPLRCGHIDHESPPTSTRKIRASSMLTSVRASWSAPQKPNFENVTIFVEYKATVITRPKDRQNS